MTQATAVYISLGMCPFIVARKLNVKCFFDCFNPDSVDKLVFLKKNLKQIVIAWVFTFRYPPFVLCVDLLLAQADFRISGTWGLKASQGSQATARLSCLSDSVQMALNSLSSTFKFLCCVFPVRRSVLGLFELHGLVHWRTPLVDKHHSMCHNSHFPSRDPPLCLQHSATHRKFICKCFNNLIFIVGQLD